MLSMSVTGSLWLQKYLNWNSIVYKDFWWNKIPHKYYKQSFSLLLEKSFVYILPYFKTNKFKQKSCYY